MGRNIRAALVLFLFCSLFPSSVHASGASSPEELVQNTSKAYLTRDRNALADLMYDQGEDHRKVNAVFSEMAMLARPLDRFYRTSTERFGELAVIDVLSSMEPPFGGFGFMALAILDPWMMLEEPEKIRISEKDGTATATYTKVETRETGTSSMTLDLPLIEKDGRWYIAFFAAVGFLDKNKVDEAISRLKSIAEPFGPFVDPALKVAESAADVEEFKNRIKPLLEELQIAILGPGNAQKLSSQKADSEKVAEWYRELLFRDYLKVRPEIIPDPAIGRVFDVHPYRISYSYGTGSTRVSTNQVVLDTPEGLVPLPDKSSTRNMPDLLKHLKASFRLLTAKDAVTLKASLDALYDPGFSSIGDEPEGIARQGGNWVIVTGEFFKDFAGFIVTTDDGGRITGIRHEPGIKPDTLEGFTSTSQGPNGEYGQTAYVQVEGMSATITGGGGLVGLVPGAQIRFISKDGTVDREATTGPHGRYLVSLPPVTYTIIASADGYGTTALEEVRFRSGTTYPSVFNLFMDELPPSSPLPGSEERAADILRMRYELLPSLRKLDTAQGDGTLAEKVRRLEAELESVAQRYRDQIQVKARVVEKKSFENVLSISLFNAEWRAPGGSGNGSRVVDTPEGFRTIPEITTDMELPWITGWIRDDFRIRGEADAKAFQGALSDLKDPDPFSSSDGKQSIRRSGDQWVLVQGKFFDRDKGFIVETDGEGKVVRVDYSLDLATATATEHSGNAKTEEAQNQQAALDRWSSKPARNREFSSGFTGIVAERQVNGEWKGLDGARVRYFSTDGTVDVETVTDTTGSYQVSLPKADFSAVVSMAGFTTHVTTPLGWTRIKQDGLSTYNHFLTRAAATGAPAAEPAPMPKPPRQASPDGEAQKDSGAPPKEVSVRIDRTFGAPPGTQPSGLAWDGNHLWMSSYMKEPGIYRIDPADGTVIERHSPPIAKFKGYGGLAFDGKDLWHTSAYGDQLSRLAIDPFKVAGSFQCPDTGPTDMAWVGGSLWLFGEPSRKLYRFDQETSSFGEQPVSPEGRLFPNTGAAFDGTVLWVSAGSRLAGVDPADGKALYTAALPHNRTESLAWDGEALWAASFNEGVIYRLLIDTGGSTAAAE